MRSPCPPTPKGIIHVVGRSSLDTREMDGCDCGNTKYSKYAPTVIFNDVFVPWDRVFLCGEYEFAVDLVVRFSAFTVRATAAVNPARSTAWPARPCA